jgi:hypothetical protein
MNYGKIIAWAMIALSFLAAIGYYLAGDNKHAAYYFFSGCILWTVTTL